MRGVAHPPLAESSTRFSKLIEITWLCILFSLTGCKGPMDQGVVYSKDDPLFYKEDQFGNRIPDYSTAGYGSGTAIPQVPNKLTLSPTGSTEDDTRRIQEAIDKLSELEPDANGARGALLLEAGEYRVSGQIRIKDSGIVLRGTGQFEDETVLLATGAKQRSLIVINGRDPNQEAINKEQGGFFYRQQSEASWEVVDDYAPSGRDYVQVAPLRGLVPGDTVILEQRMNQDWVNILGMESFPPRPDGTPSSSWDPADFVFQFERPIQKIDGGRVYLNAPLVNPIFVKFGSSRIFKPALPNRVRQSGVEHLRLVTEYVETENQSDEKHAWTGVEINRARDCWVRGVTTVNFGHSTVSTGTEALFVTVEDCAFLNPIARDGYGRKHGFLNAGQQVLFQRCFAEDCSFPFFIPERTKGPNVFLDCYASGTKAIIGPWRYWSMGTLWDNCYGQRLIIRNRGYDGQGWGWSGINHLFWNSTAFDWISVQSPINGWNWAIGSQGQRIGAPFQGLTGHISSHGKPVKPRSLYMKQMEDRLGTEAGREVFSENQRTGAVLFHVRDTLAEA
ncbi:MAG: hypothetical protein O7C75_10275 [Verrucomicrobia bacterium]|nr:hypothetical protein [Verrucomicrobiota bacterium]